MSDAIFETTHDMIMMARRNLDQDNWDYICGAAESETSLRRNRMALDCLAFRPRICRDVSEINTETDFFGHKLRIPVLLAPMGGIERFSANGGIDVDNAAEEFGSVNFLSTVCQPSLEEVADNSPHPKSFQIYVRGDDDWIKDLVAPRGQSQLCLGDAHGRLSVLWQSRTAQSGTARPSSCGRTRMAKENHLGNRKVDPG